MGDFSDDAQREWGEAKADGKLDNLVNSLGKYTGKTADDLRTQAMDDIQSDIVDELMTEIETAHLISYNAPIEVQFDTENLREWLKMYYIVEKK